jgi:hypothetical protein
MASTNEDVVVLATAPLGDGRQLLVVRHLPDRGTVEIGWWTREEGGGAVAPGPSALELAAEAVEVDAVARLCEGLLAGAEWDVTGEGEAALAESPPFFDGARVAAVRSESGVKLVRHPEGGELVLPSRAALALLVGTFPVALRELKALGFGLVQQGDQASATPAKVTHEPVIDW